MDWGNPTWDNSTWTLLAGTPFRHIFSTTLFWLRMRTGELRRRRGRGFKILRSDSSILKIDPLRSVISSRKRRRHRGFADFLTEPRPDLVSRRPLRMIKGDERERVNIPDPTSPDQHVRSTYDQRVSTVSVLGRC
jgi:hypothetical protein